MTVTTATFRVDGMTCGHCVSSVQNEVSSIPGVTSVDVDLTAGHVTVTSDSSIDSDAVRSAVEEAGYEVVT